MSANEMTAKPNIREWVFSGVVLLGVAGLFEIVGFRIFGLFLVILGIPGLAFFFASSRSKSWYTKIVVLDATRDREQ